MKEFIEPQADRIIKNGWRASTILLDLDSLEEWRKIERPYVTLSCSFLGHLWDIAVSQRLRDTLGTFIGQIFQEGLVYPMVKRETKNDCNLSVARCMDVFGEEEKIDVAKVWREQNSLEKERRKIDDIGGYLSKFGVKN